MHDDWNPKFFYENLQKYGKLGPPRKEDEEPDAWIKPSQPLGFGVECESPIETRLAPHLINRAPENWGVETQYRWQKWRMDFAILDPDGNVRAFIECDGREFHSTRAQLHNDAMKDRAVREAGICMFRFTGSKIYRHAAECAQEVWSGVLK